MSRSIQFDIHTEDSTHSQTGRAFHRDQHVLTLSLDSGVFVDGNEHRFTLKTFDLDSDPVHAAVFTGDGTSTASLSLNLNVSALETLLGTEPSLDLMCDVRDEDRDLTLTLGTFTVFQPVNQEDDVVPAVLPDPLEYGDLSVFTAQDGSWEGMEREEWLGSVLSALSSLSGGTTGQVIGKTETGFEYVDATDEETDPIFTASPAGGISAQDILDWAEAHGWGNHAGLYDPSGTAESAVDSHESAYDHANYDIAYGWGDHSLAGYLTTESDTLQTVTDRGASTTNDLIVGNLTIGSGEAGVDYTLTFDGEDNDGVITWLEDEDAFDISCSVRLNGGQSINEFSTDDTLAGDSDSVIPTESAVKGYVDTTISEAVGDLGTMSTQDVDSVAITGGAISGVDDPTDEHGVGDRGYNDLRYLTLDCSNDPLTGNLEISKVDPEIRLTDSGNNEYTRITRSNTSNEATRYNRIEQPSFYVTGGTKVVGETHTMHVFTTGNDLVVGGAVSNVTMLLVGAGGGGARHWAGGGGASGGVILKESQTISIGTYPVVIGKGGAGGTCSGTCTSSGSDGEDTTFYGLTALGGGGGGAYSGKDGGSGSGAGYPSTTYGTGLQPSSTDGGYGNNGGAGNDTWDLAGGGGGSGGIGETPTESTNAGNGGLGLDFSSYFGTDYGVSGYFAGGGGGGSRYSTGGNGHSGGGNGGSTIGGFSALANTGSGGGGSGNAGSNGGEGGSGIVIVMYPNPTTIQEATIWKSEDGLTAGEKGIQTFGDEGGRTIIEGQSTRFNNQGTEIFQIDTEGDLVFPDNYSPYWGTGKECTMPFDGVNQNFNLTSGHFVFNADVDLGANDLFVGDKLVVGIDQADLAFMTSKAKIVANTSDVSGVQMGNIGTSSGTDFRFIIKDATDHYFAFSQPGTSNTLTLWGRTRSTFDTIFNTGGTSRDLIIGSQNDLFLGAGGLVGGDIRLILEADGDLKIPLDNVGLYFGAGDDASIKYDGTNLVINPKEVGSGYVGVLGDIVQADSVAHKFGTDLDMSIDYDGTQGNIKTDLVAPSDLHIDCGTDKTLVLDETVYDDLPPANFSNATIPAANAPTYSTFSGNFKQYQFDIDDFLYLQPIEVTHTYKEGTDFSVHIHWATGGTNVDASYVKWEVEYLIADGNETFAGTTISNEVEIPADTPALTHMVSNIDIITGTNFKIGAYILCIVKRIASAGTAPSTDPFGLALGVHVEQDTLGSRQLFIK